jgi:hypothetical protein
MACILSIRLQLKLREVPHDVSAPNDIARRDGRVLTDRLSRMRMGKMSKALDADLKVPQGGEI